MVETRNDAPPTPKESVGPASDANSSANKFLQEVNVGREDSTKLNSPASAADSPQNKLLNSTADAACSGDLSKLSQGVTGAYEQAKGDPAQFKAFTNQLGDKLKDSGISVQAGTDSLALSKNGKTVDLNLNGELDMKSGNLKASVNASSPDGTSAQDVFKSFAASTKVDSTTASPLSTLNDPSASAESKIQAALQMAQNGQSKFTGADGKSYEISIEKYKNGVNEVDISGNDSKGHSMPVLRGLVNSKTGAVSHERDSKGNEVDYVGDRAKSVLGNDPLITTNAPPPEQPTKPAPPPEQPTKPAPPPEQPSKPAPPLEQPTKPARPPEQPSKPAPPPEQPTKPVPSPEQPTRPAPQPPAKPQEGPLGTAMIPVDKSQPVASTMASTYGDPQGTASGRPFRPGELTAAFNPAHLPPGLTLQFGDVVKVTHDGKSVDVTLTDKGPYVAGRGIDLSTEAGKLIGITESGIGVGAVTIQKVGEEPDYKKAPG